MVKRRLVIAGGRGFMGTALVNAFKNDFEVVVLTRGQSRIESGIRYMHWDAETIGPWAETLEGSYALINLCGRSVDCRYTAKNKAIIYASRLNSTKALGSALQQCKRPPEIWLNAASATIYRHAEDRPMTELDGEIGHGFSVDVCQQWEHHFFLFAIPGVRQVALRTAIVLGRHGGALKPLKTLSSLGFGGKMGNGKQMFSWVHIADFVAAVTFILDHKNISGAVNISAPNPVQNRVLMAELRNKTWAKYAIPLPKWVLEIGAFLMKTETELVLKSRWVLPERLLNEGFQFQYPTLKQALKNL